MVDQPAQLKLVLIELEGREIPTVIAPQSSSSVDILALLGIKSPEVVILLVGGALSFEGQLKPRLKALFSRGLLRALEGKRAVIITGGTKFGVMEQIGLAVSEQDSKITLVGVAPTGKAIYPEGPNLSGVQDAAQLDPNHTSFVLTESKEWGSETRRIFDLAQVMVDGADKQQSPVQVITILAGGRLGGIVLQEALQAVRKGWQVIVLEGYGELPDEIVRLYRSKKGKGRLRRTLQRAGLVIRRGFKPGLSAEWSTLLEIVEDGRLSFIPSNAQPSDLEKLISGLLEAQPSDSILLRAWKRFALYDINAARHQKTYKFLRTWPIILGVVSTFLVLFHQWLLINKLITPGGWWQFFLNFFIILVPIAITVFLSADKLFKSGSKWMLLRYYAEGIKGDIYIYRVLSGLRSNDLTKLPDKPDELAQHMTDLSRRLMRTEVNESALIPYTGKYPPQMWGAAGKDDGFSDLSAEDYIHIRIDDQINYYTGKTVKLERMLRPRQWLILIFGAMGALLAALGGGFQFWVPFTVAVVSALTAFLEYQQVEQSLIKYNQSMTSLGNVADRWEAMQQQVKKLSPEERTKKIVELVEETERTLQSEFQGWVQQMQAAQVAPTDGSGQSGAAVEESTVEIKTTVASTQETHTAPGEPTSVANTELKEISISHTASIPVEDPALKEPGDSSGVG